MAYVIKAGSWIEKQKPLKGELDLSRLLSTASPSSYTFSNGLTETAGVVKLGGAFVDSLVVAGSVGTGGFIRDAAGTYLATNAHGVFSGDVTGAGDFDLGLNYTSQDTNSAYSSIGAFIYRTADYAALSQVQTTASYVSAGNYTREVSMGISGNGDSASIQILQSNVVAIPTITIASNVAGFIGAQYNVDYSANYTNRSLTDKEYVDTAVSDIRLKENVKPIDSSLELINQLKPVTFNMKKDGEFKAGFIAQDLQEVFPDMVVDGEYLKIKKDQLIPYLVKAIQELSFKLDQINK